MYQAPATISGQKYKAEAKYINETRSEWYVPPATAEMPFEMLQKNRDQLQAQVEMWQGYYVGAKKKEARNLDIILQVQGAKLDEYNAMIEQKYPGTDSGATPPVRNPGDPLPPEKQPETDAGNKNLLLYAAAGLALILILKK